MSDAKPEVKGRDAKPEQKEKAAKKNFEGIGRFISETKAELKKIVWPTPKQIWNNTLVVLLFMLVLGVFIWCLDALTTTGFQWIVNLIK